MVDTPTTERRVPLREIVLRPDFQGLTAAQQNWVKIYLASGELTGTYDALSATKAAYPAVSANNLASRTAHVQSHSGIKHIIHVAFGEPENEMTPMLEDLRRAIRKSIKRDGGLSADTMVAIKFYERQSGKKMAVTCGK
jgi:hypothetical protein